MSPLLEPKLSHCASQLVQALSRCLRTEGFTAACDYPPIVLQRFGKFLDGVANTFD